MVEPYVHEKRDARRGRGGGASSAGGVDAGARAPERGRRAVEQAAVEADVLARARALGPRARSARARRARRRARRARARPSAPRRVRAEYVTVERCGCVRRGERAGSSSLSKWSGTPASSSCASRPAPTTPRPTRGGRGAAAARRVALEHVARERLGPARRRLVGAQEEGLGVQERVGDRGVPASRSSSASSSARNVARAEAVVERPAARGPRRRGRRRAARPPRGARQSPFQFATNLLQEEKGSKIFLPLSPATADHDDPPATGESGLRTRG